LLRTRKNIVKKKVITRKFGSGLKNIAVQNQKARETKNTLSMGPRGCKKLFTALVEYLFKY
jgi:hypothetical protein